MRGVITMGANVATPDDDYHSLPPDEKDKIRIELGWRPRYESVQRSKLAPLIDGAIFFILGLLYVTGLAVGLATVGQRLLELITVSG